MKKIFKIYLNYTLFILLSFSVILSLVSSYILWFILPRGEGIHGELWCMDRGAGHLGNTIDVFSLVRYEWIDIHNWASVILIIIIIMHIIIHWEWIGTATLRMKNNINKDIKKVVERYYIFGLLSFLFLLEGVSGFVIWLILPRGSLGYLDMINGTGHIFWSLQRNIWVDIHAWIAVSIISLIIIHLILNWKWIISVSRRICSSMIKNHKEN